MAWIFCVALTPDFLWKWQGLSAAALLGLTVWLRVPPRELAARLSMFLPFLLLISVGLLGQPNWGLRTGNLALKGLISLWVMTLLMRVTPQREFVDGLRRLRAPAIVVDLIGFLLRYSTVFTGEWQRMQLARRARTFDLGRRRRGRLMAEALGLLFIRAYDRAERVHRAMLARGHRSR